MSFVVTTQKHHQSSSSFTHVAIHVLTPGKGLRCLFLIHTFCSFVLTYRCQHVIYKLVRPFTSFSQQAAVGNAGAKKNNPFVGICDAEWFKTNAVERLGTLAEQSDAAILNKKSTKSSAGQCHTIQCCETRFFSDCRSYFRTGRTLSFSWEQAQQKTVVTHFFVIRSIWTSFKRSFQRLSTPRRRHVRWIIIPFLFGSCASPILWKDVNY